MKRRIFLVLSLLLVTAMVLYGVQLGSSQADQFVERAGTALH